MSFIKALWKSALFFIIFALATAALVVPYMGEVDKKLSPVLSRLMQDIISLLPLLFTSWVMTKFIDKTPLKSIGLRRTNLIRDLFIGTAIGLFWISLSLGGQYLFGTLVKNTGSQMLPSTFLTYTLALLINAAAQEVLCRGYIFQTIKNNTGLKSAVIVTSLLFMCIHPGALKAGIVPSLNVFGAGLIFAIAYYKTGNLWMPMTIHFVWNFICSSIFFIPITGYEGLHLFQLSGSKLLAGGEIGVEATIITTITIAIIVITEFFVIKQRDELAA